MKQTIKTLVADDEKYSLEELKFLLKEHPSIQITGEASTGQEALSKIISEEPELLLLDIDMPEMTGTELAVILKKMKNPPLIIFTTAYSEYAVDAFKVQAAGYLLKPVDETELAEAVRHAAELLESRRGPSTGKLAVGIDEAVTYLNPCDILFASRENNTTSVISLKGTFKSRMTLKDLESRLSNHPFFRVHKSYIVNTDMIIEMTPWFNGAFQLALSHTDVQIPVSRNYVKALRTQIEL
ncbi:Transcriptional regulatory protein YpdB [Jeotgalicoccus saudimassiliensis]|uniref:Transcriptional regulatory protein YpdB n=1 Tax=Jeotgalicoccus saudimassiliensis TaxID=1461582 RepID=A0A078M777_9STAP|nr:LytTR family DNA-binding domain-containing protein [Jeotgalicoccus saudimassiliensis]CEA02110.1 Transcriptional regulatory protein YpdB [Jeotgalicoccus saudimassiliensis]